MTMQPQKGQYTYYNTSAKTTIQYGNTTAKSTIYV